MRKGKCIPLNYAGIGKIEMVTVTHTRRQQQAHATRCLVLAKSLDEKRFQAVKSGFQFIYAII